jgi:hypothetical protein
MWRLEIGVAGQIGDGSGQLEYAVEGARRELQLLHRLADQRPALVVQRAGALHLARLIV